MDRALYARLSPCLGSDILVIYLWNYRIEIEIEVERGAGEGDHREIK